MREGMSAWVKDKGAESSLWDELEGPGVRWEGIVDFPRAAHCKRMPLDLKAFWFAPPTLQRSAYPTREG